MSGAAPTPGSVGRGPEAATTIGVQLADGGHPRERYWRTLLGVAPRLLGLLDRERRSPTHGSFDRVNWAWKFRDFPLTMWQASMMPLASLYRTEHPANPYRGSARLAEWLGGAITHTLGRQHRNGAFDSVTPFSQDHGVTLAMVLTLCTTVEELGDTLPMDVRDRTQDAVARACRFAATSDEDYAFINNHQAAFALAYLRAARFVGDAALAHRGHAVIDRILAHQSVDGWFEEYGGPDPGYETFGLTYLALAQRESARDDVTRALERSVDFLSHCIHPDGSVGGVYGSRNTGQFAPGGLECLAHTLPMAQAVADFVGARLPTGNVVTPEHCDDDNLPLLTFSYAVAATVAQERRVPSPPLPCQRDDVLTRFDGSGVVVAATQRYYAVTNLSKGGVVRVFDRASRALAYEDAGYVIESEGRDWSTQLLGESVPMATAAARAVSVTTRFSRVRRDSLTPAKFLVLRILNLTLFRSVKLGALMRRMIIARLITGRERGGWILRREITFEAAGVRIRDEVAPDGGGVVTFVALERSLLPIHMGSAKYFHANELADLALPALDGWKAALNAGKASTLTQDIGIGGEGAAHRYQAGGAPTRESTRPTDHQEPPTE